jgi:hypothetical protein
LFSFEKHSRMDIGDLTRSSFINAKQSESKTKVLSPDGKVGRLKRELCTGGPRISNFYFGLWTMGVVSSGKLDNVSLTSAEWVIHHQLLPHVGKGCSWPWMLRLGLSFSTGCGGYGSARPCCMSQVVLLMSAVQDVIPYPHLSHCYQTSGFLMPYYKRSEK